MYENCYQEEINNLIDEHLDKFFNINNEKESPFKSVIKYTLQNGKRIRPAIGMDIYNTLCNLHEFKTVFLAIEYIHSSSLIIDDLPCMDNATFRRNNQCVHKKYGEATAQLTSALLLALASNAMTIDIKNPNDYNNNIYMTLLNNLSSTLAITTHGQMLDLSYTDNDIGNLLKDVSKNFSVEEIIMKKTGMFFESSFLMGWLLGGGSPDNTNDIKHISFTFSMAFQIIDDIEDMEEDLKTHKKNMNQNYAIRYGFSRAINKANEYLLETSDNLKKLNIYSDFFNTLITYLFDKVDKLDKLNNLNKVDNSDNSDNSDNLNTVEK